MIKKILWFLVIIFVLYLLLIFIYPNFADNIESKLGIQPFNNSIRNFKTKLDNIYTNLPTKDEVKDAYNKTLSGAQDLKDTIIDGAYSVKDGVDDIRKGLSGAVDKYDEIKNSVNEAKTQFQEGVDKIKDVTDVINDTFSGSLGGTGDLEGTGNTLNNTGGVLEY